MLSINNTTAATESITANHCQITVQYVYNLLYHAAQYDIVVSKRITDVLQNRSLKAIKSLIPAPNNFTKCS